MDIEAFITFAGVIIQGAISVLLLGWGVRKFGVEKTGVLAEANNDNINSAGTWIDTYNKMFSIVQDRDAQIIELKRRVLELEDFKTRYESEREQRLNAERERDELTVKVQHLELKVATLQIQLDKLSPVKE